MNLLEEYRELESDGQVRVNYRESHGLYNISYLHGGVDFNNPLTRMARGLVIDGDGNIIARGFEKFFNYRQLDTYDTYSDDFKNKHTYIDSTSEVKCYEKLDGTMIVATLHKGEPLLTTSTSMDNDYIERVGGMIAEDENILDILSEDYSLVFEYVSPDNRIVVDYEAEDLVLLASVDNELGAEVSMADESSTPSGISTPKTFMMHLDSLIDFQRTNGDREGFIVINDHGVPVKFKTDFWFEQNHSQGNLFFGRNITKNDVASVLGSLRDDEIDDLFAIQNANPIQKKINKVGRIEDEYRAIERRVKSLADIFYAIAGEYGEHNARRTLAHSDEESFIKGLTFNYINNHEGLQLNRDHKFNQVVNYIVEEIRDE